MNGKIDLKKYTILYLIVWFVLVGGMILMNKSIILGEWDDYSAPVASIMNEGNFTISQSDIDYYKELFPNWADLIDSASFSGYMDKSGTAEYTWYFPVYSLVCVPMTMLLKLVGGVTTQTFAYTNLIILGVALWCVFKYLKCDDFKKFLLVLALTINPIVFYIGWPSAEVMIYSMLMLGCMFWYRKSYKRAALFVAIAGMLNPTIMVIGIAIIVEYFVNLLKDKPKDLEWKSFIVKHIPETLKFGSCFVVGIIPLAYNYINIGHINLTASLSKFTEGSESTFSRFISYIFDLNYGILPYFPFLLIIAIGCVVWAVIKRKYRYLLWIVAVIANIYICSMMTHINCGMSGMARYSAWIMVVLIFAVVLLGVDEQIGKVPYNICCVLFVVGDIILSIIIGIFNPFLAANVNYCYNTPIADYVLTYMPQVYNPLMSTFNSRTRHIDGGYEIETPVVYCGLEGNVCKILATNKDVEYLSNNYVIDSQYEQWFKSQLNKLDDEPSYISIPSSYGLRNSAVYNIGDIVDFSADVYNADKYFCRGFCLPSLGGTWTRDERIHGRMMINSDAARLNGIITAAPYDDSEVVLVYVNDVLVYINQEYEGGYIEFEFDNPGNGNYANIDIYIPSATNPYVEGFTIFGEVGLCLGQMAIYEK